MIYLSITRGVIAACLGLTGCASELQPDTLALSSDSDVCDIAEPACRSHVLAMVAALRGKPVPAEPAYELQPFAAASSKPPVITADDPDQGSRANWDAAYAALQLLPSVQSSDYAEAHQRDTQLDKAHYSPEKRAVVIGPRSSVLPRDPRAEMGTLAHELTHYMQDLELDIRGLYRAAPLDADAVASVRALIEGEATYVGYSIQSRLSGKMPTAADWNAHFDWLERSYLASVSASNTPLAVALDLLPYSVGARYIAALWEREGRAAVDALARHIPHAFSQWLQPAGTAAAWPARELGCQAPVAPQGYVLRAQTQLGALGALAFLAAGFSEDMELVVPLRADTLFLYTPIAPKPPAESGNLYANRGPSVIAVWYLRFDTQAAAQAFSAAMPVPPGVDRTYTSGKNVIALAVSTDEAQPSSSMLQALDCQ